jgi:chromosome segregation ATPase
VCFRCLDEWDVFLDAINRKSISMELFKFAVRKEGEFQFIFISPQGALDVPQNKSVKIFKMGSEDQ